jgi:hypothetical protein
MRMITITDITKGNGALIVTGEVTNNQLWRKYLADAIKGICLKNEVIHADDLITTRINQQLGNGYTNQSAKFIIQI